MYLVIKVQEVLQWNFKNCSGYVPESCELRQETCVHFRHLSPRSDCVHPQLHFSSSFFFFPLFLHSQVECVVPLHPDLPFHPLLSLFLHLLRAPTAQSTHGALLNGS